MKCVSSSSSFKYMYYHSMRPDLDIHKYKYENDNKPTNKTRKRAERCILGFIWKIENNFKN